VLGWALGIYIWCHTQNKHRIQHAAFLVAETKALQMSRQGAGSCEIMGALGNICVVYFFESLFGGQEAGRGQDSHTTEQRPGDSKHRVKLKCRAEEFLSISPAVTQINV